MTAMCWTVLPVCAAYMIQDSFQVQTFTGRAEPLHAVWCLALILVDTFSNSTIQREH